MLEARPAGQLDQLAGERPAADDEDARSARGRAVVSGDAGTALVDQGPRRLGRDAGVPAVGVGPDRRPELLVERRAADEHDVVVADARAA